MVAAQVIGQRRHDHARRHVGQLRAQRHDAGDRLQPAAVDRDPRQRLRGCFAERCVDGIEADRERCEELVEQSLAMCTALAPKIGYDAAAAIAKEAYATGKTVRELATQKACLPPDRARRRARSPGPDRRRHPRRRRRLASSAGSSPLDRRVSTRSCSGRREIGSRGPRRGPCTQPIPTLRSRFGEGQPGAPGFEGTALEAEAGGAVLEFGKLALLRCGRGPLSQSRPCGRRGHPNRCGDRVGTSGESSIAALPF